MRSGCKCFGQRALFFTVVEHVRGSLISCSLKRPMGASGFARSNAARLIVSSSRCFSPFLHFRAQAVNISFPAVVFFFFISFPHVVVLLHFDDVNIEWNWASGFTAPRARVTSIYFSPSWPFFPANNTFFIACPWRISKKGLNELL